VSRALLVALALALALTGCETSAEKSAKLEKEALASNKHASTQGLQITRPSNQVKILASTLVHDSEGSAAVVELRNETAQALQAIPIAIEARDNHGASVYSNTAAGVGRSLVSVPYLAPHGQLYWVDDQVQGNGTPVSLSVRVGQASAYSGPAPAVSVTGVRSFEDPANGAGAEGSVRNGSAVPQRELVVFAVALSGARVLAAGRAVVPELGASASMRFQAYLVGEPAGARLQVSAPPSTLP